MYAPCMQISEEKCYCGKKKRRSKSTSSLATTFKTTPSIHYHPAMGEFYPGEEDILASRGEILPEELHIARKLRRNISSVKECRGHPCSEHTVYYNKRKDSHSHDEHLLITVPDSIQIHEDGSTDMIQQQVQAQVALFKKVVAAQREDDYYYEDPFALSTVAEEGSYRTASYHTSKAQSLTTMTSSVFTRGSSWGLSGGKPG